MNLLSKYGDELIDAFLTTIYLTLASLVGALVIGTIIAAMRVSPVPIARGIAATYVTIFRNTPLTLIILFTSFGLYGTMGVSLASETSPNFLDDNNFRLAILGLSVYTASFVAESLRSGSNTVPVGQAEAGRSLGMTFTQNISIVVLPQAFRAVVGPLGSVVIALTKNTTIASVIGVAEASFLMKEMIENEAAIFVVGGIFALGFMVLTLPTGLLFGYISKRLAVS